MWTGGASAHLDAFVNFIQANKLDGALRTRIGRRSHAATTVPAYAQNAYDKKMAAAYARWKTKGG